MESFKAKLLIATPELLSDHIFSQSVIYIVEHFDGAMGFIINKPLDLKLVDNQNKFPSEYQVWDGGPVNTERVYYLHNKPELFQDSIIIDKLSKISLGNNNPEDFKIIFNHTINQENIKFFRGYSGWDKGQLEREIQEKAWFVYKNPIDIFNINTKNLWKKLIIEINPQNIIWKNAPLDPNLN